MNKQISVIRVYLGFKTNQVWRAKPLPLCDFLGVEERRAARFSDGQELPKTLLPIMQYLHLIHLCDIKFV